MGFSPILISPWLQSLLAIHASFEMLPLSHPMRQPSEVVLRCPDDKLPFPASFQQNPRAASRYIKSINR